MEPSVRDLTNIGLPALKFCECLISLSIVLSERNYPSFKRVKNIGMFYVSEGCRRLELVKLGGFAKVKKFEVLTSPLLSDLVFDNMIGVARWCSPTSLNIPRAVWNPPLTRRGSPQAKCAARVGVSESDTPKSCLNSSPLRGTT
ncbi:hypothetical protein CQW23_18160 [Capsicum baccatum]|uniref:F-box/LRR-repeat protein 15-like leucin rich repeat domain-containing protein n=1 Tax=Capsicum baccatum TaxID=33114 RepID=A0A2G2WFW7_CAPBA|nr:hypothetical protein CQW23_18160 [Capsicum baccatum]